MISARVGFGLSPSSEMEEEYICGPERKQKNRGNETGWRQKALCLGRHSKL